MRRTLLALLLAISSIPSPAWSQYLGPPVPVRPPPPVVEETEAPEPPPPPPPPPASSQPARSPLREPEPAWSVHRLRVWGTLGATWSYGYSSFGLGAGVGYLAAGGLLPSLDVGFAFGSSPTVFMLKPGLDWFLPVPGRITPFVGGYYAHWFVSGGYLPQDAWGVRGGFSFAQAGPATFLLGIAYEQVFTNCTGTCGYLVPQVAVGFAL